MKLLEVFVLAVLACSLAEGRIVPKCELRDQLVEMIGALPQEVKEKGLTAEYLVAPAVCHVELVSGFNTSAVIEMTHDDKRKGNGSANEVWMLYGLFQLSNHLVCSDGSTPSPSICGLDCADLIDDNPSDDIACVLKIFTEIVKHGFWADHLKELRRMVTLIYQEDCNHKAASTYFAECNRHIPKMALMP